MNLSRSNLFHMLLKSTTVNRCTRPSFYIFSCLPRRKDQPSRQGNCLKQDFHNMNINRCNYQQTNAQVCKYLRRHLKTILVSDAHHHHHHHQLDFCHYYSTAAGDVPMPPWRILFLGSDDFALVHLKALHENMIKAENRIVKSIEVVAAKQRQSKVKKFCRQQGIGQHDWPLPTLTGCYDVGMLASFGNLIPERIINMFPYGIINVHPSLLPRYRGGAPITHTILNGDKETGISIMDIRAKRFDVGPLLVQQRLQVPPHCSMMQLQHMLAHHGAKLVIDVLGNLAEMKATAQKQPTEGMTLAPIVDVDVGYANWEQDAADEIERQFYAFHEMFDFKSMFKDYEVKFYDIIPQQTMQEHGINERIADATSTSEVKQGHPFYSRRYEALFIRCKDGWVGFKNIFIKKHMSTHNFYHGYLTKEENKEVLFESKANSLDKYMLSKKKR